MSFLSDLWKFVTAENYYWATNILQTLVFCAMIISTMLFGWWVSVVITDIKKEINKTGEKK